MTWATARVGLENAWCEGRREGAQTARVRGRELSAMGESMQGHRGALVAKSWGRRMGSRCREAAAFLGQGHVPDWQWLRTSGNMLETLNCILYGTHCIVCESFLRQLMRTVCKNQLAVELTRKSSIVHYYLCSVCRTSCTSKVRPSRPLNTDQHTGEGRPHRVLAVAPGCSLLPGLADPRSTSSHSRERLLAPLPPQSPRIPLEQAWG